jgi:hypothetical protein
LLSQGDTEEQKQRFRDDPKYYLEFRKAIENKINGSFRGNIKDHLFQKKGREVNLVKDSLNLSY